MTKEESNPLIVLDPNALLGLRQIAKVSTGTPNVLGRLLSKIGEVPTGPVARLLSKVGGEGNE